MRPVLLRIVPRLGPPTALGSTWTRSFAAHCGSSFKFYFDTLTSPPQLGLLSPCCSSIFINERIGGESKLPHCFVCQAPMARFYPTLPPLYVRDEAIAHHLSDWLSHLLGPLSATLAAAQIAETVDAIRRAALSEQRSGNPFESNQDGERFVNSYASLFNTTVELTHD